MRNSSLFRRSLSLCIVVPAVCLFLTPSLWAGAKKPIQFAPGANSVSIKGDIQGMDRDTYPITAKAGQKMSVTVKNKQKLVLFRIQMPGNEEKYLPKAGEDDDATEWKGVLPASGAYTIIVGAMKGNDTKYVLTVQITD